MSQCRHQQEGSFHDKCPHCLAYRRPAAPSVSTDHTDEKRLALIRRAIADPGRFTSRLSYDETVPAWGARAVLIALDRFEVGRG